MKIIIFVLVGFIFNLLPLPKVFINSVEAAENFEYGNDENLEKQLSILPINDIETGVQYEYITFAINEDYAQSHPDWEQRAQEIMDFVNTAFEEDTGIQYQIAQFKTYSLDYQQTIGQQLWNLFSIDELHFLNDVEIIDGDEKPFSTTVLFTVVDSSIYPNINDLPGGNHGSYIKYTSDGTEFIANQVHVSQDINEGLAYGATILGRDEVNSHFPDDWRNSYGYDGYGNGQSVIIHELGHSFGIGVPENYLYNDNIDNSGVAPILPEYNFSEKYGLDSMGGWLTNEIFNEFNASMIKSNKKHQRDWLALEEFEPTITVKVVNKSGWPFYNARVRVYGSRTGCIFCGDDPSLNDLPSPLLATYYTNQDGIVDLSGLWERVIDRDYYVNYIIKVDYNGEVVGDYLSRFDVQYEVFFNNRDYEMVMELNKKLPVIIPDPEILPDEPFVIESLWVEKEKELISDIDSTLIDKLEGRILLQVEEHGGAWCVDESTSQKYYLKDGATAYEALRKFGLGISNLDLAKIPIGFEDRFECTDSDGDTLCDKLEESLGTDINKADSDGDVFDDGMEVKNGYNPLGEGKLLYDSNISSRLKGKILLQVEEHGEAWYVNPNDGKRYYMADGSSAYQIMRFLSLGISNIDIRKIPVGDF